MLPTIIGMAIAFIAGFATCLFIVVNAPWDEMH
jgi:hypothetical protein